MLTHNDNSNNLGKRDSVLTVLSVKKTINVFNCLEEGIFSVNLSFYDKIHRAYFHILSTEQKFKKLPLG